MPLPRSQPAPKIEAVDPPIITASIPQEQAPQLVHNRLTSLPEPGSRTAVYDISAHTVYLPSGERLEAHSGLGDSMDDPRSVNVKMRGATPPNVYNLTLRESCSTASRRSGSIRSTRTRCSAATASSRTPTCSVPNGQSNGCVSFKDYPAFLRAVLRGEVDRMVVVAGWRRAAPSPLAHRSRAVGPRLARRRLLASTPVIRRRSGPSPAPSDRAGAWNGR